MKQAVKKVYRDWWLLIWIIVVFLIMFFSSCKPKPEFYIDGKPYYTRTHCVKSHTDHKYGYHYGYNFMNGKFEWHTGSYTKTICDESRTDTLEIKL